MHSRICNRELFKWYIALNRSDEGQQEEEEEKEEVERLDFLQAKNKAETYQSAKAKIKQELGTEWTANK